MSPEEKLPRGGGKRRGQWELPQTLYLQSGEGTAVVPLEEDGTWGIKNNCSEDMLCAPRKAVLSAGLILLIHLCVCAYVYMNISSYIILHLQCSEFLVLLLSCY